MTLNEAREVAKLWKFGYHGDQCPDCALDFAEAASKAFPNFVFTMCKDKHGVKVIVSRKDPSSED